MKEYGEILIEVPAEHEHRASPYWEARTQAALMGGTLTGQRKAIHNEITDVTVHWFEVEREVPECTE